MSYLQSTGRIAEKLFVHMDIDRKAIAAAKKASTSGGGSEEDNSPLPANIEMIMQDAFSRFGNCVSVRVLKAKNIAFAHFSNIECADNARIALDGAQIANVATLRVSQVHNPKTEAIARCEE